LQESIYQSIPFVKIDENQKYWLVRTQSGDYYQEFYHENFIGVGWDELDLKLIHESPDEEQIIEYIKKQYPDEKQPGRILNQIKRFLYDIKIGDIVLIPSHSSLYVSFGVVVSNLYIEEVNIDDVLDGKCPFQKRKKVRWLKTIRREELDPYLYRLLNSHHTITDATPYSTFIDRTLHSFYIKGNSAHLIFGIQKPDNIPAVDLVDVLNKTLELIPIINSLTDSEYKKEDIDIRLTLNSPGIIEIVTFTAPALVLGIGVLLHYLIGGKLSGKMSFTTEEKRVELESSSDGLLEKFLKIKKHVDQQKLREMELSHKMAFEKLQVKLPTELKNLPDPSELVSGKGD